MSPLEIPLKVRKEMEIAWCQVRAVGGWERTSNFSVSRASIVARAVCGLVWHTSTTDFCVAK